MVVPLALGAAGVAIGLVAKFVTGAVALTAQAGSAAFATGKQAASSVMSGGKDVADAAGKAAKGAAENPEATGKDIATDAIENNLSNALTGNRSTERPNQDGQERSNNQQNDSQQNNVSKQPLATEKLNKYHEMCQDFMKNSKKRWEKLTQEPSRQSEKLSQQSGYTGPQRQRP